MIQAAVIGHPIDHSKSPAIHSAAYQALGLDTWKYSKFDVEPQHLVDFIEQVDESWAGFSITMPLKEAVFEYVDQVDPLATKTKSINTAVLRDGVMKGYNTDVYGITQAITSNCSVISTVNSLHGVILGSGATARSAYWALRELGVNKVTIASRKKQIWIDEAHAKWVSLDDLISDKSSTYSDSQSAVITISTLPWAPAGEYLPKLYAAKPQFWKFAALECAFPKVIPQSIDGFTMLIWQAIQQIKLMTNQDFDENQMFELLLKAVD